jgi:molybdopterin-guanine dinucleotide biosynthesis protein MobB
MTVNLCAIVGASRSGKTLLLQKLISELRRRGRSVGAIKHCPKGFELDTKGKDSWVFTQAGADAVAICSPDQLAVLQRAPADLDLADVARTYFGHLDVVLVEGGKSAPGLKKIEVLGPGSTQQPQTPEEELVGVVADEPVALDKPVFGPDEIGPIADLLEQQEPDAERGVHLAVDGAPVSLNPFVRSVFQNVVLGMVASLKGIGDTPGRISLTIDREGGRE